MGSSYGGWLTLSMVLYDPERLMKIVLLSQCGYGGHPRMVELEVAKAILLELFDIRTHVYSPDIISHRFRFYFC